MQHTPLPDPLATISNTQNRRGPDDQRRSRRANRTVLYPLFERDEMGLKGPRRDLTISARTAMLVPRKLVNRGSCLIRVNVKKMDPAQAGSIFCGSHRSAACAGHHAGGFTNLDAARCDLGITPT